MINAPTIFSIKIPVTLVIPMNVFIWLANKIRFQGIVLKLLIYVKKHKINLNLLLYDRLGPKN